MHAEVDRCPSIMTRSLRRIGDVEMALRRRRVPEHFRHEPRPVSIVDGEAVALGAEGIVDALHGEGGRALEEGPGLLVERKAHEVAAGCVPYVENERRVDRFQFDKVGWLLALFRWRLGGERVAAKVGHLADNCPDLREGLLADVAPLEDDSVEADCGCAAVLSAQESNAFLGIKAGGLAGERPMVGVDDAHLLPVGPFYPQPRFAVFFEDSNELVVPAIFADDGFQGGRGVWRNAGVVPVVTRAVETDPLPSRVSLDRGVVGIRII